MNKRTTFELQVMLIAAVVVLLVAWVSHPLDNHEANKTQINLTTESEGQ
jgi:hypothetical protein